MKALYVTSTETFSGKSAVCAGLARRFMREGKQVGYVKPVSVTARSFGTQTVDEDTEFMRQILQMNEPVDLLCHVALTPDVVEALLSGAELDYISSLKECVERVGANKDILLIEGTSTLYEGRIAGLTAATVASELNARVLVVARYHNELVVDQLMAAKDALPADGMGAIINRVPRQRMEFVQDTVKPYLAKHGISLLAALPQDRLLLSVTVRELAEQLGGEILNSQDHAGDLVENLMVGAMSVESALSYFMTKMNKAVITGGDRPDIQLAAMETSTRCLILTGQLRPSPIIMARAEELGVPMILTKQDTLSAVEMIEPMFGRVRFHQEKKIQRFERMLDSHLDAPLMAKWMAS